MILSASGERKTTCPCGLESYRPESPTTRRAAVMGTGADGGGLMDRPHSHHSFAARDSCAECRDEMAAAKMWRKPTREEIEQTVQDIALGAAWREAEAALPTAGWLSDDGRWVIPTGPWSITIERFESGDGYFEPHEEGYRATVRIDGGASSIRAIAAGASPHGRSERVVYGDVAGDPAAALRVLVTRLNPPTIDTTRNSMTSDD